MPILRSLRRSSPAFAFYAFGGLLILALYGLAVAFGASALVCQLIYVIGTVSAAGAILAGVRVNRPATRLPWLLIAAGAAMSALGDFLYCVFPLLGGTLPAGHLVDVPYLARFPLIAAGLVLLIRRRTPGWDGPALIDATIVAIAVSLVSWVFVINPVTTAVTGLLLVITAAAYPVGDLLLLAIGVRLLLGGGAGTRSLFLSGGYLAVVCGADAAYTIQALGGDYAFGPVLQLLWIGASVLLGMAALHPSMTRLDERTRTAEPTASAGRLAVLALASLLAPATLVVQTLRHADGHPLVVSACCGALFLLVVGRLAGLVRAQRRTAITDSLTGLRTRRFFEESLTSESTRSLRTGEPLSLVLLDVDHFKRVNDTYGHSAGDLVLCEVARRLRSAVRSSDVVARYGGEEFAVLLPGTEPAASYVVAERLREVIAATGIELANAEMITVTVSAGMATIPVHAPSADDLVLTADRLLYDSKETGRNRVSTPPELVPVG